MRARLPLPALLAGATLVGVSFHYVLVELHRPELVPANDVYAYFLPNIMYAVDSVAAGGKGLLWNPLQACGEPFFANTVAGLLYPPHWLFLFLEPNLAVHVVLIFNMAVGAIGMLLLCRGFGLGWVGAFAGALAFQLGDPLAQLTSWSPMHNGPWVWLPWTLLFVERLLRAPSGRNVVGLTLAVVLQLLPGFVLIAAFTYQLIAFRIGWELIRRRAAPPWKSALAVGAGLALAPMVLAVQLVPAAEYAGESFRVLNEDPHAVVPTWVALPLISVPQALERLATRDLPIPFSFALVVMTGVAAIAGRGTPVTVFYLFIATLYGIVGFGSATPLYAAFIQLPPGAATLRLPYRFFWLSGLAFAVLSGVALHWLAQRELSRGMRRTVVATVVVIGFALYCVIPGGLQWPELAAGALIIVAALIAALSPALAVPSAWLMVAAVGVNLFSLPLRWPGHLLSSIDPLFAHAEPFARLRAAMTPQERVLIQSDIVNALQFRLMPKTASLLRVPNFHDYEALLGYRFSRYYMAAFEPFAALKRTRADADRSIRQHRLLDLAAVRYIITPATSPYATAIPDVVPLSMPTPDLRILRNSLALERVRYVPRIEVIEPESMLQRLKQGTEDARNVAFVEAAPASGFFGGEARSAVGRVRFLVDDPEHIELEVVAPERGFLVLADTYFPGWQAAVNGERVPIQRANYMFRLVEVSAGSSRVTFRYRPRSLVLGAGVSLIGVLTVLTIWFRSAPRQRRLPPDLLDGGSLC